MNFFTIFNTFIIFLVSGFWHGANLTFIAWGGLNAIYFLPLLLTKKNRSNLGIVAQGRMLPTFKEAISIASTFALPVLAFTFFRADNMTHAFSYIGAMFSSTLFTAPQLGSPILFIAVAIFFAIEWMGRERKYALENLELFLPKALRWALYYALAISVLIVYGKDQQFIYFQF